MLHKTKGIVLRVIPYNDKNKIVKIYTENFGLLSFITSVGNSKSTRQKAALLQPLQPIFLELKPNDANKIHRLGEINLLISLNKCAQDYYKRLIILFLNEVLYKCLRAEEKENSLFNFLITSLQILEEIETGIGNFPLAFICNLTKYLGIAPQNNYSDKQCYFNSQEGYFQSYSSEHKLVDIEPSKQLSKVLNLNYNNLSEMSLNSLQRKEILNLMMTYYTYHLPSFSDINSLEVMEELS